MIAADWGICDAVFFPDKAFPDLSMHCNSFKWKRCSSQAGEDQKQGINDSNPMSDVVLGQRWEQEGPGLS